MGRRAIKNKREKEKWLLGGRRAGFWTESLAVCSREFVDATLKALWPGAKRERIEEICAATEPREFILRESIGAYGEFSGPKKRAVRRKEEGK